MTVGVVAVRVGTEVGGFWLDVYVDGFHSHGEGWLVGIDLRGGGVQGREWVWWS